jgi:hypothetical protein
MRLTTDNFRYFKEQKLFCCSIDSISNRVNDCVILDKNIILTNPKSGGSKLFCYKYEDKAKWVYLSGNITLYVYKGEHKGIPSPGIVIPDKQPAKPIKMVKTSGFADLIQSFTI